jgi:transposase
MRDLSRALGIVRENLTSAKLRVMQAHHRYGLRPKDDMTKGAWTVRWQSWAKSVRLPSQGACLAYDHHMTEALRLIDEKKRIEHLVHTWCDDPAIKHKADALMAIKGISKTVAFCLITEIGEFSRFKKAGAFSAFLGLVPSENSSGKSQNKGNITRTGNEQVRKSLIEASWCYARMKTSYKKAAPGLSSDIICLAHRANTRLLKKQAQLIKTKKPCVANAAVARELSCFVWQIAVLAERGMDHLR